MCAWTVELAGKQNGKARMVSFMVGDNDLAGQFNSFRHGYAGTIYKGQGRTTGPDLPLPFQAHAQRFELRRP